MKTRAACSFVASLCIAAPAFAQPLDLPRPSPNARVTQTIGLTEITVEYSSPGVKGRQVWGTVVPYDKVWRTGANAATKITFGKDVVIADKTVAAGSYSIFTIPGKTSWTVILNKNPTASTQQYKEDQDLLRVTVTPTPIPLRERLAFVFSNFDESGGSLDLEWEKVRVGIPIKVATEAQAMANITALTETAWRPYNAAARYLYEAKKHPELAMQLVDKSLALKEDWFNLWTKAQLVAQKGDKKGARSLALKAKALGDKSENFFVKDEVNKALNEWK